MSLKRFSLICISFAATFMFTSCLKTGIVEAISETQLFEIPYGNFENQMSVFDLNNVGSVRKGIAMRDGFFYVVDGESKKIMEMNSYGDLLTLFYNEDSEISRIIQKSEKNNVGVHKEISYPFDYPGNIAVDSNKIIYAVCTLPRDRQEQNEDGTILYSQTVLRFSRDVSTVDYIGQQGPGGTPFPYIRNIYTTDKDELVVVSSSNDGMIVYWFASNGYLKYMIPVKTQDIPKLKGVDDNTERYLTIENVIPDLTEYKLHVKVDYYSSYVDEDSKIQAGVNYVQTLLYPLNVETGVFEDAVSIPPYEETVVADYCKIVYKIPYDFLGVTKNGWKFFIIKTEKGFNIEMIQNENQKILRRHFDVDSKDVLYYTMGLSQNGILNAMYLEKDNVRVVWYRTDNLIDAILKN